MHNNGGSLQQNRGAIQQFQCTAVHQTRTHMQTWRHAGPSRQLCVDMQTTVADWCSWSVRAAAPLWALHGRLQYRLAQLGGKVCCPFKCVHDYASFAYPSQKQLLTTAVCGWMTHQYDKPHTQQRALATQAT